MATSSRTHAPGRRTEPVFYTTEMVDALNRRNVEVWRPADETPHVETEALVWEPAGAVAPFRYALAELFAPL